MVGFAGGALEINGCGADVVYEVVMSHINVFSQVGLGLWCALLIALVLSM